MVGQQIDSRELRAVGQRMPVWSLAAEIERQTADAVVGKLVGQHEGDFPAWVKLVRAKPGSNAGVAATDDQKPHAGLFRRV
jgi:hypothetical protein